MMKIYYKETENSYLKNFGIRNCYFKGLEAKNDFKNITEKPHLHTGYEIHLILKGVQHYIVGETEYKISSGEFLIIPPNTVHSVKKTDDINKISITFNIEIKNSLQTLNEKIPERINQNIKFILSEAEIKKDSSLYLIENSVYEIIVLLLRKAGRKETDAQEKYDNNTFLKLAKSYIKDNIEAMPDVYSVAQYCHLSERQLNRIFNKFEDITVAEYIRKKQTEHIEKLFCETDLSIKEISDRMNFSSEYYFNYFFKKNSGMTPGEYKRMHNK